MNTKDFIAAPCRCGACVQAGVTALELRRDPRSGAWLHGYDLKRWYAARDEARQMLKQHPVKGMR